MPPEMLPGMPDAQREGCTCPTEENNKGNGAFVTSGEPGKLYFVVEVHCPLHGMGEE